MNTLIAVSIVPLGRDDNVSSQVAEVIKVIRDSGLPNKTNSMFTEIEGPWDEVMKVVKESVKVLTDKGIRTEIVLKADIRPGHDNMINTKVEKIEKLLDD
ncbi:MTH1187 family thiamine-binding protein [Alkalibacterium sp. 20]|uniref:MTH1187 family thiamine-binding protein n=1 Tax=Alkalibacterium sp. 20 TaxID=1798803 RepID=UPI0009000A86|nr:MTH1187 family thiamine-binding protein [Alkalibacterium sp. 20]OJF97010.1 hypothetical protein AX762_00135 [Alkalibacterium sp. 20]